VLRDPRDLDVGDRRDLNQATVEVRSEGLESGEIELLEVVLTVSLGRAASRDPGRRSSVPE
jgi:hypothetical protein